MEVDIFYTTPGIKRVETLKILGVTLSQLLSFEPHIDKIVAQAAKSMYALILRAYGLHGDSFLDAAELYRLVSNLTFVSKILREWRINSTSSIPIPTI